MLVRYTKLPNLLLSDEQGHKSLNAKTEQA